MKPEGAGTGRRRWLAGAAALACPGVALRASEPFPSKPITLWVPWPAGGATDICLRLMADIADHHLRQRVVVENRPGAGGTLAMPVLQQAAPDGYTIAQIPQPVLRVPYTQKVLWDPVRDVTPILQLSGVSFTLMVLSSSRLRTIDDLFAFARSRPGELSIATNGVGTTPHVVLEDLFTSRGLRYIHVPYKGAAEQLLAVDTGQVMVGFNSSGFAPLVESGRLRLIATTGVVRTPRFPQVPTLKELGIPIVATSPYGLGGPRDLPPAIVETLHDAFRRAVHDPAVVAELGKFDQEVDYLPPAAYGQWLREQYAREKVTVERMGLARLGN